MGYAIRAAIVAALVSTAMPIAHGQGVWLEGTLDCGLWVTARKERGAAQLEHFLIGLLNGLSIGSRIEFWRARGSILSRQQVYLWMDNYCAKNALSEIFEGAAALMDEQSSGAFSIQQR